MACNLFLFPIPIPALHHSHRPPPPKHNISATKTTNLISFSSSPSSEIYLHRSFLLFKRNSPCRSCHATGSPSEPPSEDQIPPSSGVSAKDTLQIFFAVLFWMSLFFWSCAWDRGNNGRPNKDSRFRK